MTTPEPKPIEENLFALFEHFQCWSEAEAHNEDDLLWVLTSIPFPLFNNLMRARLTSETADVAIRAATARAEARKVPLLWYVSPSDLPIDLGQRLLAQGFVHAEDVPGMAVSLQALNPAVTPKGLGIERVSTSSTLALWTQCMVQGFEMPAFVEAPLYRVMSLLLEHSDVHNYLGYWQGQAVATSTCFLHKGIAGIYNVSTLSEARGRGIAGAMTTRALIGARDKGLSTGILHSSEMGFKLYQHLGFEQHCLISQYLWGVS